MREIQTEIKKIERQDWHLWIVTLLLLFIFSSFVILLVFYSDIKNLFEKELEAYTFNLLFLGIIALLLFFTAYVVIKEMLIKKLRRDLIQQKITAYNLETRFSELKALFEISTLVNSETDIQIILDMITHTIAEQLSADSCSIWLCQSEAERLHCASSVSNDSRFSQNQELEIEGTFPGWCFKHKEAILFNTGNLKKFEKILPVDKKVSSAICVPLKIKDQTRGVLFVTQTEKDKSFTETDLKLISIFAENAALSISKSEDYNQLKKQTQLLEKKIEDLKQAQDRLTFSARWKTLGKLASHLAAQILLSLQASREELQKISATYKKEKLVEKLEEVKTNLEFQASKLNAFQEMATVDKRFIPLEVNRLTQQAANLVYPMMAGREPLVELVLEPGEKGYILGNPSEMLYALVQFLLNSLEALSGKSGRIVVQSRISNHQHIISISDTGTGMNEEIKTKALEPFFTTKGFKGDGLGLSSAYNILFRHNGELKIDSQEKKGTTVVITLPVYIPKEFKSIEEPVPAYVSQPEK